MMDDQRLERALRGGPPFTTHYSAPALPLDRAPTGAIARVRPMVLLLAAVALLLVALTTALIVGALRSSALAFTCADAADAMDRNVQGWTVQSDPGAAEDAKAGMLTGFFRSSGDEPPLPPALIDPDSGQLCATVKFANGAWLQEASLFRWSPSGDALAMATERNRDGDKRGHDLLVVSEAGIVQSAVQSDWTLNFAWSPDSHRIAAFSNFESFFARSVDVWIVPDDGSGPQEMAIECARCDAPDGPLGWAQQVAWSPDGARIALAFMPAADRTDEEQGNSPAFRFWVGPIASGRLTELTGIRDLTLVRWLDDESLMAVDPSDGAWFAIPIDHPEDITEVEPEVAPNNISPDGEHRIEISESGPDSILTVTDLESGESRIVYQAGEGIFVSGETWAPDSRSIAFTRWAEATGQELPGDGIWIASLGGGVRQIPGDYLFPGPWQPVSGH